jgi:hypothetical protein
MNPGRKKSDMSENKVRLNRKGVTMKLSTLLVVVLLVEMSSSSEGIMRFHDGDVADDYAIDVNGTEKSVIDLAEFYAPNILVPSDLPYPPTDLIFYAHELNEGKLTLSYRVMRDNERHPSTLLHYPYALYRSIHYGSVKDIEYVDVVINTTDGLVEGFRFELPRDNQNFIEHVPMEYVLNRVEKQYVGSEIGQEDATSIILENTTWQEIGFLIASWNGLFDVVDMSAGLPTETFVAEISVKHADKDFTSKFKMWRRSSGYL